MGQKKRIRTAQWKRNQVRDSIEQLCRDIMEEHVHRKEEKVSEDKEGEKSES